MQLYRYKYDNTVESWITTPMLVVYNVHKETPCGYWIGYGTNSGIKSFSQWVSKNAKNKFAYTTKHEALEGFMHKRRREIKILESKLRRAKGNLASAQSMLQELKQT